MDLLSLVAKLSLDSSEYEKGLGDAESKAGSFGNALKSGLGNIAKVGVAAVGAASAAVGAFAKSSVDAGKNFDSSMSQVAATMGLTMDEISTVTGETDTAFGHFSGTLREFAQYMGANTAFSASQAADALNYMALAGYDAQTSMDMLPNVLNLAAAGGMDLATASDMVTDAQSALGLTLDETSVMVDQMAEASSKSNTSVAQLGEAFLTIGATARNLAGGTTELSTVLGVLADNGIKGAEGGTHLRNMLLALQTPTKDGTEALAQLGLTYDDMYDSAGNMRALPDIMLQLQAGMEGMTQASKDAIISGIFNKTDLAAANALIGTSKERFDELTESIGNATGAAQQMADTQLDNLAGDITLFQSALEGVQIAVSDMLTPALREFVQLGSSGLSEITTALQAGDFNGAMSALGDALSQGIQMIITMLPQMVDAATQLLTAFGQGIMQNLPQIMQAATQIVVTLAQYIISSLPQIITAAIEIIVMLVQGITEALPELIPAAVEAIITITEALIDNVDQLVNAAVEIMIALTNGIIENLPTLLEKAPELVTELVNAIIENTPKLLDAATEIISQLVIFLVQNFPQIVENAGKMVGEYVRGITAVLGQLQQAGVDMINKVWEGIKSLDPLQWGKDLISNFVNGIKSGFGNVTETLTSLGSIVSGLIGFSEPKEGPLSNFHTFAPDMIDLFIKGIKDNEDKLRDQLANTFQMPDISGSYVAAGQSTANHNMTFNIYGAQGQNEEVLANRVAAIVYQDILGRGTVYA